MHFGGVGVFPISKLLCLGEDWPGPKARFLYRTAHRGSAGRSDGQVLASASWRAKGCVFLHQWMHDQANAHFLNHFSLGNREPTMFLSATDDLLRALNIATRLHHEGREDIVITIIDLGAPNSDARARFSDTHTLTHAEAIAKTLGLEEPRKYNTEWLFLGRINHTAAVKQIHYHHLVDHGLYDVFPALALRHRLDVLRDQIAMNFKVPDPTQGGLSKWIVDEDHPAGFWMLQSNASAEAGMADGRRCAQFAALFQIRLPDDFQLAEVLMFAAWTWKGSILDPNADYIQAFNDIASLYIKH